MAYVPGFVHDVFISYAHVDNVPLSTGDPGWVADFHKKLTVLLARFLGRPEIFSVWRDLKLRGNDEWQETIDAACHNSAVGIFILSPGFFASHWCSAELDGFVALQENQAHCRPSGRSRLFKVLLSHVTEAEVPEHLRISNGYPFHAIDSTTGHEEQFRRTHEWDTDQRYWKSLSDLARDLAEMLKDMRRSAETGSGPPQKIGPTVYLAEVTDDIVGEREDLRRTLVQRGVRVLPEVPLPAGALELRERLRAELSQVTLSIHLFGSFYGKRPAGEERSFSHIQYAMAVEAGPSRLLWIPRDVDLGGLREVEQRDLLANLETEPDLESPSELLKGGLEVLKEQALSRLFPTIDQPVFAALGALIYISCQPECDHLADQLRGLLRSARHDVVLPARHGDKTVLERHYLANLRFCDALLVLYADDVLWVREELIRARRITAAERRGTSFVMSVYDGPPPTKEEEIGLDFQNLLVLRSRDGIHSLGLQQLLDRLQGIRV
jgi:hypothetical protein